MAITSDETNMSSSPSAATNITNINSVTHPQGSALPSNVHPLESVAIKMDVRSLSNKTVELRVTYAASPSLIYANFVDLEATQDLYRVTEEMEAHFSSSTGEISFNSKAGSLCAVMVEAAWKRGIIKSIGEISATVFLLDYGNEVQCDRQQLHPLVQKFKNLAAQALPMKLITVKPTDEQEEWSDEICNFLREFSTNQIIRVKPEFKDGVMFGVRIKVQDQPLDKLLQETGYAVKIEPELPQMIESSASPTKHDRKAIPFSDISKLIRVERPAEQFEG